MKAFRIFIAIACIALAIGFGVSFFKHKSASSTPVDVNSTHKAKKDIASTYKAFTKTQTQGDAYIILIELENYLQSLDVETATKKIMDYLNQGDDIATGLPFMVSPDHTLDAAPTLRVYLLDQLNQINPDASAKYAKTIFETSKASDEWAIALKSYAADYDGHIEQDTYFTQQLKAFLNNDSWLANPSIGYLQAFDALVYRGGNTFVLNLCNLAIESNHPAIAYASRLAIDRLAQRDYTTTMQVLLDNPEELESVPKLRAFIFARGDVRDPKQKDIVEQYIFREDISNQELIAFGSVFPNLNRDISYNLLTQEEKVALESYADQDLASLQFVQALIKEPRARNDKEVFQTLNLAQERLEEIKESIERGQKQSAKRNTAKISSN
ncbi:MAG TPA: hypothetical protein DIU37_02010 [Opitutae bacterium]|nr:hypothetical protein [Opitutae bacterium]